MKKEIEKRFLLKDLPILPKISEIQNIIQYYYKVDDLWYRIRKIQSSLHGDDNPIYLHTIKTYKDNVCYETERFYNNDEYMALVKEIHNSKLTRCISKTRYIYNTGLTADFEGEIKEIKWEIDVFNFRLVIAEIELPDIDFEFDIPDFINKKIITNVTGMPHFSNKFLSEPIIL